MTSQDLQEQQIGTRRHKIGLGGQEMLRHIPCNGWKMLDDSNSMVYVFNNETSPVSVHYKL